MKRLIVSLILVLGVGSVTQAQSPKPTLEIVAQMSVRPGNVAVSKTGRVFTTIHALGSQRIQLVEITGRESYKPYPDIRFQKNGKPANDAILDSPLGIFIDKKDHLWVIDMGMELGKTRIWSFDITRNAVLQKIELPVAIAPKGSFIQDLAIDEERNWAYLADINNPGIIAVNLKTQQARRFGGHAALQAEDIDMIIDGKLIYFGGKPARVAVNPITLSTDRETIYFGAMNGTTWYRVSAKLFRENADDQTISANIQVVGKKPVSDGVATDREGNHYFTNLPDHAISKLSKDGKLTTLIQDPCINWPDNVGLSDGWIYISVNQLNTTPAFTGASDEGKPPYFIYRFKYLVKK